MASEAANRHGPKMAILYARVSTDEQARSGYSLAQQMEALRSYAATEGFEILEEVSDPGQSGASLGRPGMDRVRDLVSAGDVSVVLAQDRDRFSREPAYSYLLRREFEEHGTALRALNDRGDDSPEGQLTDGILDQLAKFERAKTAERTRRGRLRKAREGKIVGIGGWATYGFRYNSSRDGYLVDEDAAKVVRRIFHLVAQENLPLRTIKRMLEREGVRPPKGGRFWHTTTLRDVILDDCYRPHAFEEIQALVSPEVAGRLDPDKNYGVSWYNRRRVTTRQVAEDGPEGRRYRRVQNIVKKDRSEWVAVPVPDIGVPRDVAFVARDRIKQNQKTSGAGGRFWELSGGLVYCAECGMRLTQDRRRRSREGPYYHYYRCQTRRRHGEEACPNGKSYRAERLEGAVWDLVSDLMQDPERLRRDLEQMIELERNSVRGDPEREARAWFEKLAETDTKRSGFQDMAAEGLITLDELRTKLAALEEIRATAQQELETIDQRREKLKDLERDKETVLEHYARMTPEALDNLTPEERHQFYKMLRLKVVAEPNGDIELSGAFVTAPEVCLSETASR